MPSHVHAARPSPVSLRAGGLTRTPDRFTLNLCRNPSHLLASRSAPCWRLHVSAPRRLHGRPGPAPACQGGRCAALALHAQGHGPRLHHHHRHPPLRDRAHAPASDTGSAYHRCGRRACPASRDGRHRLFAAASLAATCGSGCGGRSGCGGLPVRDQPEAACGTQRQGAHAAAAAASRALCAERRVHAVRRPVEAPRLAVHVHCTRAAPRTAPASAAGEVAPPTSAATPPAQVCRHPPVRRRAVPLREGLSRAGPYQLRWQRCCAAARRQGRLPRRRRARREARLPEARPELRLPRPDHEQRDGGLGRRQRRPRPLHIHRLALVRRWQLPSHALVRPEPREPRNPAPGPWPQITDHRPSRRGSDPRARARAPEPGPRTRTPNPSPGRSRDHTVFAEVADDATWAVIEELYALPVKRPGSSLEAPSCSRHSPLPWLTAVVAQGLRSGLLYASSRSGGAPLPFTAPGGRTVDRCRYVGCAVACARPLISRPLTTQGWDDLLRRENQARRGVVDSTPVPWGMFQYCISAIFRVGAYSVRP